MNTSVMRIIRLLRLVRLLRLIELFSELSVLVEGLEKAAKRRAPALDYISGKKLSGRKILSCPWMRAPLCFLFFTKPSMSLPHFPGPEDANQVSPTGTCGCPVSTRESSLQPVSTEGRREASSKSVD